MRQQVVDCVSSEDRAEGQLTRTGDIIIPDHKDT